MRRFRIFKLHHGDEADAYIVAAESLYEPDVMDVINQFAGTDAGLEAARRYIVEVTARNAGLGGGR